MGPLAYSAVQRPKSNRPIAESSGIQSSFRVCSQGLRHGSVSCWVPVPGRLFADWLGWVGAQLLGPLTICSWTEFGGLSQGAPRPWLGGTGANSWTNYGSVARTEVCMSIYTWWVWFPLGLLVSDAYGKSQTKWGCSPALRGTELFLLQLLGPLSVSQQPESEPAFSEQLSVALGCTRVSQLLPRSQSPQEGPLICGRIPNYCWGGICAKDVLPGCLAEASLRGMHCCLLASLKTPRGKPLGPGEVSCPPADRPLWAGTGSPHWNCMDGAGRGVTS